MITALILLTSVQPKILWGAPDHGIRLGYRIDCTSSGPVEIAAYLENTTNRPMQVRSDEPQMAKKPPEIWLIGKRGSFAISPPIVEPLVYDGPDPRMIFLPAGQQVQFHSSRFCLGVPAGAYTASIRYVSAIREGEQAIPLRLEAPKSELELSAANVSR